MKEIKLCPFSGLEKQCTPKQCGLGVYDAFLDEWCCSLSMIWYIADKKNTKIMEDEREAKCN